MEVGDECELRKEAQFRDKTSSRFLNLASWDVFQNLETHCFPPMSYLGSIVCLEIENTVAAIY